MTVKIGFLNDSAKKKEFMNYDPFKKTICQPLFSKLLGELIAFRMRMRCFASTKIYLLTGKNGFLNKFASPALWFSNYPISTSMSNFEKTIHSQRSFTSYLKVGGRVTLFSQIR